MHEQPLPVFYAPAASLPQRCRPSRQLISRLRSSSSSNRISVAISIASFFRIVSAASSMIRARVRFR